MVGFNQDETDALTAQAAVFGAAALDAPDLLHNLGAKWLRKMHRRRSAAEDGRRGARTGARRTRARRRRRRRTRRRTCARR